MKNFLSLDKIIAIIFLFLLTSFLPDSISAQNRFGLKLGAAANFPTSEMGDTKLNTGFGIDGTISYRFMEHISVYGGWGWNKFQSDETGGITLDFEETGYTAGLQYIQPISTSSISFLIGGGGTYRHIETENENGDIIADTGHGWGWTAETGLVFGLGDHFNLIPTIRYSALTRKPEDGIVAPNVSLNYISANLGLAWFF